MARILLYALAAVSFVGALGMLSSYQRSHAVGLLLAAVTLSAAAGAAIAFLSF